MGVQDTDRSADPIPERISRYLIEKLLGEGGFGRVYLGFDTHLERSVAIKVLRQERLGVLGLLDSYFAEARTLALLDHPNIVAVHDAGRTEDGFVFLVSKYIEGETLSHRWLNGPLPLDETVRLVSKVAGALDYAHKQGLVHRDVKPGNIMIGPDGMPVLIDFGIALEEESLGRSWEGIAGTPQYMSPEQARGEGHLIDNRSDIYSLGVIFYELLTGRRIDEEHSATRVASSALPEQVTSPTITMRHNVSDDPANALRPPREIDKSIPRELERICLRCLAWHSGQRYANAAELVDDLQHFVAKKDREIKQKQASRIVPKGLRSFGQEDSEFFLSLLPGPRDRHGLPENVRFWKTRIEEADPNRTFRVGVMYGPSGCGKSSLINAGILPHLRSSVRAIRVEAQGQGTELQLLHALREEFPALAAESSLADAVRALRLDKSASKVLIIVDQFEQWLHARTSRVEDEFVNALRQCDGTRVQCLLLVRDDFWLPLSQFLSDLEVELSSQENATAIDLFERDHARSVLAAFGRAYGRLTEERPTPREQKRFLDQAVSGLATNGKVIPVRLALFAEMLKDREWTTAMLKSVGGAEGIGVTFLDELLGERAGSPRVRQHARAARSLMEALLPEGGTTIKGSNVPESQLKLASGYANRPDQFADLLRMLDAELRLITPSDAPAPQQATLDSGPRGEKHYQLTHDYLVPEIRLFLNKKKTETRRGRAELCLEERASVWQLQPTGRNLPSFFESLRIWILTRSSSWSEAQRRMMRIAKQRVAVVSCLSLLVLTAGGYVTREISGRLGAQEDVSRLEVTQTTHVPKLLPTLKQHWKWVAPILEEKVDEAGSTNGYTPNSRQHLHAVLVLSQHGEYLEELLSHLMLATPEEHEVILEVSQAHEAWLIENLWSALEDEEQPEDTRFRTQAALARLDPLNSKWKFEAPRFGEFLLGLEVPEFAAWVRAISPRPEVIEQLFDQELLADHDSTTTFAQIQAKAAIGLHLIGRSGMPWDLMLNDDHPAVQVHAIHLLKPARIPPGTVLDQLSRERRDSARRALIQTLGEYNERDFPAADYRKAVSILQELYPTADDPGVHSSIWWTLRQWNIAPPEIAVGNEHWGLTALGQSLVRIDLPTDEEPFGGFMVSTTEVTVAEYRALIPSYEPTTYPDPPFTAQDNWPVNNVSYDEALKFCNLLSDREGLDRCYQEIGDALEPVPNHERNSGYRLPLEAEWIYAVTANMDLNFLLRETKDLWRYYTWVLETSNGRPRPVGSLKPNPFGLFDGVGNVAEFSGEPASEGFIRIRGINYFDRLKPKTVAYFSDCYRSRSALQGAGFRIVRTLVDPAEEE